MRTKEFATMIPRQQTNSEGYNVESKICRESAGLVEVSRSRKRQCNGHKIDIDHRLNPSLYTVFLTNEGAETEKCEMLVLFPSRERRKTPALDTTPRSLLILRPGDGPFAPRSVVVEV